MPDQPTPAEIRLAQYADRSTWSTATYNDGTERALHEIALGLKAEIDRLRTELARQAEIVTEFRLTPAPPAYTPIIVRRDAAYDGTGWAVLHDPGDLAVRRAWTEDGWEMAWSLTDGETYCWPDAATALHQGRQAQGADDGEPDVDGAGHTPEYYRDGPAVSV